MYDAAMRIINALNEYMSRFALFEMLQLMVAVGAAGKGKVGGLAVTAPTYDSGTSRKKANGLGAL